MCKLFLFHTVESRYLLHLLPLFGSGGVGAGTLCPAGRCVCRRDRRATWLGMRQTPRDLTRSTLSPSPSFYALLPLLTLFFLTESRYRWFFFHQCLQYVKHDF